MKILPKLLVLLVLALPLGAESLPVVTLDEAIESASENNITLKQAAISLNQKIRNENNYVKDYLPTFGLSATADTGYSFPTSIKNKTEFNGFGLTLGASANFEYTLTGSKITGGAARRLSKEAAALDYEDAYDSIEMLITSSYWTLATYDITAANARTALESAKESYESTVEMYDAGIVDELTLSYAELELHNKELTLREAENNKALAMASFKAMTGLTEDFQTEELPETVLLSLPPAEELFAEYSEATQAIREARNALSTAENTAKEMSLNQYMPTVSASIRYTYLGGVSTENTTMSGITLRKAGEYGTDTHSLTGSVTVSIPLSSYIPGSSADVLKKNSKDAVTQMALALQDAQNTLLSSIRESSMTIEQQQSSLSMLETNLEIAEHSYKLAEESYNAGLLSASDLSESRTQLLNAQNNLLSARLGHLLSSYSLANTLGITLQELQETYPLMEKETV